MNSNFYYPIPESHFLRLGPHQNKFNIPRVIKFAHSACLEYLGKEKQWKSPRQESLRVCEVGVSMKLRIVQKPHPHVFFGDHKKLYGWGGWITYKSDRVPSISTKTHSPHLPPPS